jgi:hypothetical protein
VKIEKACGKAGKHRARKHRASKMSWKDVLPGLRCEFVTSVHIWKMVSVTFEAYSGDRTKS